MAATHLHRRSSSRWVPPSAPLHNPISIFRGRNSREKGSRVIEPNHKFESPRYELTNYKCFTDNSISTTKYSLINFVPLNIWHQLTTRYANLYFILIAVLNWMPWFSAYTKYLGLIPISFVLGTTLIKDGVEDLRRWKFDNKINSKTCHVWDRDHGGFRKTEWKYILVGDFVHISNDQEVPADVLFLRSSDQSGTCFVETSNLDGETSLKQRSVPAKVLSYSEENSDFKPSDFIGIVTCEKPDKAIYTIRAKVEYEPGRSDIVTKENMLLRGSRIKNTTFAEGIVVYAGHDTKVMLNNGRAPHKTSSIERLTNKFIVICFVLLLLMVAAGAILSAFWVSSHPPNEQIPFIVWSLPAPIVEGFISVGSFFINYQLLVPISLYITVEIIKALQIYFISQDIELYDAASDRSIDCRSLSIPEELGAVTHVLSDKTGTLTENVMIFRRCAFDEVDYGGEHDPATLDADKPVRSELLHQRMHENRWNPILKHFFANILLNNSVVVNKVPHQDAIELGTFEGGVYNVANSTFYDVTESKFKEMLEEIKQQPEEERPTRLGLSEESSSGGLSVIAEAEEESTPPTPATFSSFPSPSNRTLSSVSSFSRKISLAVRRSFLRPISELIPVRKRALTLPQQLTCPYEAESPDELALIQGAALYGHTLDERAATSKTISTPWKSEKRYEILLTLPFDATRKRMSVVVRTSRGPLLYCKGADSAILTRLAEGSEDDEHRINSIKQKVISYATKGLRTLCFAMKFLTEEEFDDFLCSYRFIMEDASPDREKMLSEKADQIEKELLLLGVTGIEDRLQDGVPQTIGLLREAGIQIWVLTGDKLETAQNIATACGLFHPMRTIEHIDNDADAERLAEATGCNIILSPSAVKLAQDGDKHLVKALLKAKSVLCYRMTPSEKAAIVKTVQKNIKGNVLAIGDGANDVPMIQAADVGIGIAGKEGLQAAMACDFAIARFRFLGRLLLVHGHWCYHRLALSFLYFLYKNTNAVFTLFFFQFYDGYSGTNIIDPMWGILYPIIFTSVQPIFVGVLDQDEVDEKLMQKPELYAAGREGRLYTTKLFFINVIDGIYQSAVIYFVTHLTLENTNNSLWEVGFYLANAQLFVNSLHLAVQVRYWQLPLLSVFIGFILLSFLYFFGFCNLVGPGVLQDTPVGMPQKLTSQGEFWFVQIVTLILAIFPRFATQVIINSIQTSHHTNKRA